MPPFAGPCMQIACRPVSSLQAPRAAKAGIWLAMAQVLQDTRPAWLITDDPSCMKERVLYILTGPGQALDSPPQKAAVFCCQARLRALHCKLHLSRVHHAQPGHAGLLGSRLETHVGWHVGQPICRSSFLLLISCCRLARDESIQPRQEHIVVWHTAPPP